MRNIIWLLVLLLVILHQDNWLWGDTRLVFGFIPISLFYHMCISLAAGVTWYLATVFAWPDNLEWSEAGSAEAGSAKADSAKAGSAKADQASAGTAGHHDGRTDS